MIDEKEIAKRFRRTFGEASKVGFAKRYFKIISKDHTLGLTTFPFKRIEFGKVRIKRLEKCGYFYYYWTQHSFSREVKYFSYPLDKFYKALHVLGRRKSVVLGITKWNPRNRRLDYTGYLYLRRGKYKIVFAPNVSPNHLDIPIEELVHKEDREKLKILFFYRLLR